MLASSPCTILITRPEAYADALKKPLEQAGIRTILFPCLAIEKLPDSPQLRQELAEIESADALIFISQAAVHHAYALAKSALMSFRGEFFAIGWSTAAALRSYGLKAPTVAPLQHSQSLLALPHLQEVANQKIALITGVGGNLLLQETLTKRGATVSKIALYQRKIPSVDAHCLANDWQTIDILTTTSGETLSNLVRLLRPVSAQTLFQKPLLVVGETMLHLAKDLGFMHIVQAQAADNASILAALLQWQGSSKQNT